MIHEFISLFNRDLNAFKKEVEAYPSESSLWVIAPGTKNPTGNLVLHIIGNLNHFIGDTLGHTGYIRKRDEEFTLRDIPKDKLIQDIEQTRKVVEHVLNRIDDKQLSHPYPIQVFEQPMTLGFFLIHLHGHLNYHLGQANYHRRMLVRYVES